MPYTLLTAADRAQQSITPSLLSHTSDTIERLAARRSK